MEIRFLRLKRSLRQLCYMSALILWSKAYCFSQGYTGQMEVFKPATGMQINHLTCNTLDKDGFLWFGTRNYGLIKYTGFDYESFMPIPNDSMSLGGESVVNIASYGDSLIVALNGHGIDIFDRTKGIFYHLDEEEYGLPREEVNCLTVDHKNRIWIGFENNSNVFSLDLEQKRLTPLDKHNPFEKGEIKEIVFGNPQHLWASLKGVALIRHDFQTAKTTYYSEKNSPLSSNRVDELVFINDTLLCVANDDGLEMLTINEEHEIVSSELVDLPKTPMIIDQLLLNPESPDYIWMGSKEQGLYRFYWATRRYTRLYSPFSYTDNNEHITSLFLDNSQVLWVGTTNSGTFYVRNRKGQFNDWENFELYRSAIGSQSVTSIFEDTQGILWAGTAFNGLYGLDFKNNSVIRLSGLSDENSLSNMNSISSIVELNNGEIWYATQMNGIYKVTGKENDIQREKVTIEHLENGIIRHMILDSGGKLWIGTKKNLIHYDPESGSGRSYTKKDGLSSVLIRHIYEAPDKKIWIGTDRGLNALDLTTNSIEVFTNDPSDSTSVGDDRIRMIHIDRKGRIWVGTKRGGLNQFIPEKKIFKRYPEFKSYNVHTFFGVAEFEDHLWFSTKNGIIKFDPEHSHIFQFLEKDGLQGNEFEYNDFFQNDSGKIYFGGPNGINAFHPGKITVNEHIPPVYITKILTKDERRFFQPSDTSKFVELSYNQKDIKVDFCALDYTDPLKNEFQYKLENYHKNWHDLREANSVNFTNLHPGTYRLHVLGSNNHGVWNLSGDTLTITITPAWWQKRIARIGSVLLVLALVVAVNRLIMLQKIRTNNRLEAMVAVKTKELNLANRELSIKNNEIQSQNEELNSNYEEIMAQRDDLEEKNEKLQELKKSLDAANLELKTTNENLEDQVKKRTEHLKKANNELDKFVYSASHDLSAPLKSIKGLLHLGRIDPDGDHFKYYDMISGAIEKLEMIIKNLLQLSRNTSKNVEKEEVNVKELISGIVDELKYSNQDSDITVQVNGHENTRINIDVFRLMIVLRNLISNAIKYADPEKRDPYVKIDHVKKDGHLIVSVEDNGIGMEPDQIDKVFEMFYRATTESSGSGLGLYIVKEALNKINGEINVTSVMGNGSTFSVRIPAEEDGAPSVPATNHNDINTSS